MFYIAKKKQFLNSMKMFFETLNKRRQCVHYLYTCKLNNIAVPWRYPLKVVKKFSKIKYFIDACYIYIVIVMYINSRSRREPHVSLTSTH